MKTVRGYILASKENADIVCCCVILAAKAERFGGQKTLDPEGPKRKELRANISSCKLTRTELLIAMPCNVPHQVPYMEQTDFNSNVAYVLLHVRTPSQST